MGMKLLIEHNGAIFEPPVKDEIKIEWERTSTAGKLSFTTIKVPDVNMTFLEGDRVQFFYDDKLIFVGYVFTKKRTKEHHIEVTCYDQLRYLKNKFSYVFTNKTASQIVKSLCDDFQFSIGEIDDSKYVIPSIAEENQEAFEVILNATEETLANTGTMFILYDDAGKIMYKNAANMMSDVIITDNTAEDFDYTSSIDNETYNSIVLYYKDDAGNKVFHAQSEQRIKEWGLLRYFEEVKTPSIGQNKTNALLELYNRKTRELKVTGAFGVPTVRGGTLLPVILNLGDLKTQNYMIVEKVTHNFNRDNYTMDLTLDGAWED